MPFIFEIGAGAGPRISIFLDLVSFSRLDFKLLLALKTLSSFLPLRGQADHMAEWRKI